jgi:predicted acetyltransferase
MQLTKQPDTLTSVSDIISYAFNKQQPAEENPLFLARYDNSVLFGNFHAKVLSSFLMLNPFTIQYFGKTLKMGGIGYVASLPEYRGQGGIGQLIRESFSYMHEEKVLVSNLAPFSESFYRHFGYEDTIYQKCYDIPAAAFQSLKSETSGKLFRGSWQDPFVSVQVTKLHQQQLLTGSEVGTINREAWWWNRRAAYDNNQLFALSLDDNGEASGYVTYVRQGSVFKVTEMCYTTGMALRQLMTFLKSHVSSFKTFSYAGAAHEQLERLFGETREIQITYQPYMMSRIIDFPQLLAKTPFLKEVDSLVLEVTEDKDCPWNTGKWLVESNRVIEATDDLNTIAKTSRESMLTGSIQSFSALLLGTLTIEEGLLLNLFTTNDELALKGLFPKGNISFYDYF